MPRFSERAGERQPDRLIQVESIDDALRASLWNELLERYGGDRRAWGAAGQSLARYLLKVPADSVPEYNDAAYKWLRELFFNCPWYEAYDILEFLVLNIDTIQNPNPHSNRYYNDQRYEFVRSINGILERELAGYRFINGILAPISNSVEVSAIETAISASATSRLDGVHEHLSTSLELLGRKPQPDFRNSIKESISAVEAAVNLIAGSNGSGVAGAIDALSAKTPIHGALKAALKQLYGYTSDSDGIRHAIMEEATVDFEDAKFMLVACSAFVTFLIGKASKVGLVALAG
jgi:AbiJ N-terminal domain 4